jgi:importin subunit alpha-4/3
LDGINNMLKMAGPHAEHVANLIEECDGLTKIEDLQNHENVEIYKLAYDIIEQYFSDDVVEDDGAIQPQVDDGNFQFNPSQNLEFNF